MGFDYSDFSDVPADVRRWVRVLRVRARCRGEVVRVSCVIRLQAAATITWGSDQGREDTEVLNNQRNFQ